MDVILRLTEAVEQLTVRQTAADLELRCFTPEEAARLLGKTENWVVEAIRERRIPFTYVGRSPRLTADHIRWVQANGEVRPSRYAKPAR
ncbi:excisionase family DNA-binding protein [Streptomyces sp. NPDC088350]|uniref:excisionase family DNA-binding protein n=1 Tax=Streptomyces sp. NPDC088350 TaxID=3365854 RepID=UPI003808E45D